MARVAEREQALAVGQAWVPGVQVRIEGQAAEQRRDPQQAGRQERRRPPHPDLNSTTATPYLWAELDFGEPKFKTEDGVAGPSREGNVRRRRPLAPSSAGRVRGMSRAAHPLQARP